MSTQSFDKVDGQDIACIFRLNPKVFAEKYQQAISGLGQEARRIRTLHSSSLLCLLCFYGVSEERPLSLNLEGRQITFTSSRFEVKSLVGTDETGQQENNMRIMTSTWVKSCSSSRTPLKTLSESSTTTTGYIRHLRKGSINFPRKNSKFWANA